MRRTHIYFFSGLLLPLAVFILASASICAHAAVKEDTAKEAVKIARDVSGSSKIQSELPDGKNKRDEEKKGFTGWRGSGDYTKLIRIILIVAVAAIVIIIIMNMSDNLWSRSRARRLITDGPEAAADTAKAVARMDKAQFAADDLAGRGDYAEAMHVLLLQSVFELRRRLDVTIAASLTSREILARVRLPGNGREFFADIIGRVEVSYFGLHDPGREDYLACRRSFERLTESLGRRAAQ